MSNLQNLPQLPLGTEVFLSSNSDWTDQIYIAEPGFSAPFSISGALTSGANTFGVTSSGNIVPGMLALGWGLSQGTTVESVSPTSITLSGNASITAPNTSVTFMPPPLDLTGIAFTSEVRISSESPAIILSCSTALGTMTNGDADGTFGWYVPASTLEVAPWPRNLIVQGSITCVLDIIATDATGARINLCTENGPIPLTINLSVTR